MSSFKLKVLLCGAAAVGKTSLVQRFIKNRFAANYKLTVGVDILTKDVEFRQGEIATLSIWDIGGQQRFEFIRSTFYKGAAGALLVFDLSRAQTYQEIRKWLTEVRQFAGENIPFVLIGNKADLIEDVGEVIDRNEARNLAESEGSIYLETSAKTGQSVDESFTELTRRIIDVRTAR
jgi:small GTP-binding protein